jgi:ribosome-associated protein
MKVLTARKLALACKAAVEDKKALDPVVLNVGDVCTFTEFFVICSAQSEPQLRAIANSLRDDLWEKAGRKPEHIDGGSDSLWIVVDFGEVVVHIFHEQTRMRYQLEQLWSDAPVVKS